MESDCFQSPEIFYGLSQMKKHCGPPPEDIFAHLFLSQESLSPPTPLPRLPLRYYRRNQYRYKTSIGLPREQAAPNPHEPIVDDFAEINALLDRLAIQDDQRDDEEKGESSPRVSKDESVAALLAKSTSWGWDDCGYPSDEDESNKKITTVEVSSPAIALNQVDYRSPSPHSSPLTGDCLALAVDDRSSATASVLSNKISKSQSRDSLEGGLTDHLYVGKRIGKYFPDKLLYFGTITHWFPKGDFVEKLPLWNIKYDDGDDEGLHEPQVKRLLKAYEKRKRHDPRPTPK
ncbi:hypothetical protein FisN_2Lu567 [Fistulifera solaris]|uniref:Uncharacterized protein n=1 Tax=Fistulifera solaris TaxID=1519565 RepID=A0A1Z5JB44_FISSO|nr:hypothetical protein FisN_2Lu567 [Fistulifera solaris]|eukprot:GAX11038.1 hypothetical protein FisN_2Lu567 [Fistulifera solaris]